MADASAYLPSLARSAREAAESQSLLTTAELLIVRGWYANETPAEIGRRVGLEPRTVLQKVRWMRARGVALPERSGAWAGPRMSRARRHEAAHG